MTASSSNDNQDLINAQRYNPDHNMHVHTRNTELRPLTRTQAQIADRHMVPQGNPEVADRHIVPRCDFVTEASPFPQSSPDASPFSHLRSERWQDHYVPL